MLHKLPQAVLFDHDGVLVDSESLHSRAWARLLAELGLSFNPADMRRLVGKTGPQILESLLNRAQPDWSPDQYDIDALAWRKNDFYLEEAKTGLRLFPGVREGLLWLQSIGIKTAVVSNAKRRELVGAHDFLGTTSLFNALISRDESGAAKPDPTPYLVGAATVGVDPRDCLAVEDAPPGLEAALLAKVPTAAVLTSFPREAVASPVPGRPDLRPIWIGDSIQALFQALQSI